MPDQRRALGVVVVNLPGPQHRPKLRSGQGVEGIFGGAQQEYGLAFDFALRTLPPT
ncbi:hypothetical protein [Dankookia sp. P2]|uniref:hypothetical protein n=1 Tax=Dankookia sp. P2 TaxID=3423955 RepID=UPI003D67EF62